MSWGKVENRFYEKGYRYLAGTDEVGRGCLAGPVFAAAVILPQDHNIPGLNDSKKLSAKKREELRPLIEKQAVAFAIIQVSVQEIDKINILQASLKAMQLAVMQLEPKPDCVLIDGKQRLKISILQEAIVKGDQICACIAAASILAKVSRDQFMVEQQIQYPEFSFDQHKGYGTARHLEELKQFGPSPLHRLSFAPVKALV